MSDREPANRLYADFDITEEERLPPSEEIICRLLEADFSAESSLRKTLRDQLEQRMQADLSRSWLERLGLCLPVMGASTPIKVALLIMALLAQVVIAPSPSPAVTEFSQPSWSSYATASASAPPATLQSTAFAAYQPIPIPTPGVEVLLTTSSSELQTASLEANVFQTDAVTPRPTPLAPLTMLP